MSKIIIFDFDGVLADSVDVLFEMNQKALEDIDRKISKDEYISCFEGHINQGLTSLLNLTEDEKNKMIDAKANIFPFYYNKQNINLFPFAKDLIIEASKLGELWIVSSALGELIKDLLDSQNLSNYFARIIGQNKQPKSIFFRESLCDKKKGEVFFITDTTGDIKEMRKAMINSYNIAVTWGFHDKNLLEKMAPDKVVKDPQEILGFIRSH